MEHYEQYQYVSGDVASFLSVSQSVSFLIHSRESSEGMSGGASHSFSQRHQVAHPISWSVSADRVYIMWQAPLYHSPLVTPAAAGYADLFPRQLSIMQPWFLTKQILWQRLLPPASPPSLSQLDSFLFHTWRIYCVLCWRWPARLDLSSRAKPFQNEYKYKSVILNIVWLCTALGN